jgi:hypothetical protein
LAFFEVLEKEGHFPSCILRHKLCVPLPKCGFLAFLLHSVKGAHKKNLSISHTEQETTLGDDEMGSGAGSFFGRGKILGVGFWLPSILWDLGAWSNSVMCLGSKRILSSARKKEDEKLYRLKFIN